MTNSHDVLVTSAGLSMRPEVLMALGLDDGDFDESQFNGTPSRFRAEIREFVEDELDEDEDDQSEDESFDADGVFLHGLELRSGVLVAEQVTWRTIRALEWISKRSEPFYAKRSSFFDDTELRVDGWVFKEGHGSPFSLDEMLFEVSSGLPMDLGEVTCVSSVLPPPEDSDGALTVDVTRINSLDRGPMFVTSQVVIQGTSEGISVKVWRDGMKGDGPVGETWVPAAELLPDEEDGNG